MTAFFRQTEHQHRFNEDGFVQVDLLSPAEVAELADAYREVAEAHEKIGIPYITTSHSNNRELITRVDERLQRVMAPAIDRYLCGHRLLFGNYLVKMPVPRSETSPHQDITFVDETRYASANVWVALQDTDTKNGCMYFLKGSHAWRPTLRPTHSYPWTYAHVTDEILKHVVSFPAKAGQAFIFNHAVVHGSHANTGAVPRLAAVMAAYPSEAELLHYYLPGGQGNRVQKYGMTKEAFLSFVKEQPPREGIFLEEVEHEFIQLQLPELTAHLPKARTSVLRKLFGFNA